MFSMYQLVATSMFLLCAAVFWALLSFFFSFLNEIRSNKKKKQKLYIVGILFFNIYIFQLTIHM